MHLYEICGMETNFYASSLFAWNPHDCPAFESLRLLYAKKAEGLKKKQRHLRQKIIKPVHPSTQENTESRGTAGQTALHSPLAKEEKIIINNWPACKRTRKGKVIEKLEILHTWLLMAIIMINKKLIENISGGLQIESRARPFLNYIHTLYKDHNLTCNQDL